MTYFTSRGSVRTFNRLSINVSCHRMLRCAGAAMLHSLSISCHMEEVLDLKNRFLIGLFVSMFMCVCRNREFPGELSQSFAKH